MADTNLDPSILATAKTGDRAALQQLLLPYYDQLIARVTSQMSNGLREKIAAEDVLQEVYAQAVRDIGRCRAESKAEFSAWLLAIANNRVRDVAKAFGRAKRGAQHRHVRTHARSSLEPIVEMLELDQHSPSSRVAIGEAERAIQMGVAMLPDEQRTALRLRYLEGRSLADVAEQMEKTPAAVRGLLHRAKVALRETMGNSSRWFLKK